MPLNTDRLLRAVFFLCMEMDSERPTVRQMLHRLRQIEQPMRQETVRLWLKNEHFRRDEKKNSAAKGNQHEIKAGHNRDTIGTRDGTRENPVKSRDKRADGTQILPASGHLRARDKKVLNEIELGDSVLYSQNVVARVKENETDDAANAAADAFKAQQNIHRLAVMAANAGVLAPQPDT